VISAWESWSDGRFVPLVLGGTAVSMAAFLLFALPLTWVAWAQPAWAQPWRIQARRADVARWWWPSVGRWLVNNVALLALLTAAWPAVGPLIQVRTGPTPGVAELLLSCLAFIWLDDLLYYAMHRAMHHGWLYRRVHSVHHRISTPSAISGHYMHPVEFIATGLLMLLGPVLAGSHVITIWAWIVLRQLEAAEGHGGFHLPFSPLQLVPGNHGADFHDFHHSKFTGNYAGFLAWVDRALGTWARGYAEHAEARGLRWWGPLGWGRPAPEAPRDGGGSAGPC
jgi:4-alpha-methyl-delta7-sterol-4alpha-methyl oxidase